MKRAFDPNIIDQWLPQTQCQRCGYPGCWEYALAISTDSAPINRCPPGGETTLRALSEITNKPLTPLDENCGTVKNLTCAVIDEALCIGCTLCSKACPIDAIIGASKLMHTVVSRECTGCELCITPCPMNCITMTPITRTPLSDEYPSPWSQYPNILVAQARKRANRKRTRSQLSAKSLGRNSVSTDAVMQKNILSSVKRTRARRKTFRWKNS